MMVHWSDIFDNETLSPHAKLVYCCLVKHADKKGECFPSIARIKEKTGLSRSTVIRMIAELTAKGVVRVTKRASKSSAFLSNVYTLVRHTSPDDSAPVPTVDDRSLAEMPGTTPTFTSQCEEIIAAFHETCPSLPKIEKLTEGRKQAIKDRLKDFSLDDIFEMFVQADNSDFLNGHNNRGWTASFDWLMKGDNFVKVLEGTYQSSPYEVKAPPKQETVWL